MTTGPTSVANSSTSAEPTCSFCNRKGLPILPLRYGVVRTDKGKAPDLVPPFDAGKIALPKDSAKYSLRILRPGFLYMFDEARGEWSAYAVTDAGYLYQFDFEAATPPQVPDKFFTFACIRKGDPYMARCVTVRDAEHAGNIWLGFSDVMWTQQVREDHRKEEYRRKHMRRIDIADVRAKNKIAHTDSLKNIKHVAEFSKFPPQQPSPKNIPSSMLPGVTVVYDLALSFSHQSLHLLGDQAQGMIDWAVQNAHPYQPVMTALSDPAGVATELALLMHTRMQAFMHDETKDRDRVRKTVLSSVIEQLMDSIRTQAEQEHVKLSEEEARKIEIGYSSPTPMGGWVAGNPTLAQAYRNISAVDLQNVSDKAWKKYNDMYSEPNRTAWQNTFNDALVDFDKSVLSPLALAHRDWMKCDSTAEYFACNFDTKVPASGAVYLSVFSQCIASTQDKVACAELYSTWIKGDLKNKRNLLLRALCLNHDILANEIEAAVQSAVTWAQLSWDKLMGIGKSIFDQLLEGEKAQMARLTVVVSGAITSALKEVSQSRKVFSGLVALGVMARSPFVEVTIEGGKKAFRQLLIRTMLRMNDASKSLSENRLQQAVSNELRRQEIIGVDMKGSDKKTWLVMVDPDQVKSMPKGLTAEAQAKWLATSIRRPEQVEALDMARFRDAVSKANERTSLNLPFGFAVVALVANAWAMQSILSDDQAALAVHKDEMRRRVYTQGLWVVGATADAIEAGLTRLVATGMRFGQGAAELGIRIFGTIGKILGVAGGILMAVWDGWRAYDEWKAGHNGAAVAYFLSSFLGVAATALLAIGWTGWGLIVVAVMFLWAFIMTLLTNDKIQDWLELCYWGRTKDVSNRYRSSAIEMQQLDKAIKG